MGGKLFSDLSVPRMPPDVYLKTKTEVHAVLSRYFHHVGTPREAPGKKDYGDVDVLVAGPIRVFEDREDSSSSRIDERNHGESQTQSRLDWSDVEDTMSGIYQDLHAVAKSHTRRNPITSLAIPWPLSDNASTKASLSASRDTYGPAAHALSPVHYTQLDVHLCHSLPLFTWTLFHQSYGDLWNILGSTIRKYGLTANDTGLHLRIEEIDLVDRKRSLVFLTHDPDQVLAFLGLDGEAWKRGFTTTWEMYEFAATCRMFSIGSNDGDDGAGHSGSGLNPEDEHVAVPQDDTTQPSPSSVNPSDHSIATTKRTLKHNDRKRMASRPIFAAWIEDFLPYARTQPHRYKASSTSRAFETVPSPTTSSLADNSATTTTITMASTPLPTPTRAAVVSQAFTFFGSHIESAYTTKLQTFQHERNIDQVWRHAIKAAVPVEGVDPALRAAAIRGLKALVLKGETVGAVSCASETVRDAAGFLDAERVRAFVARNWEAVGCAVWAEQKLRDREAMGERVMQKATKAAAAVAEDAGSGSGMGTRDLRKESRRVMEWD